MSYWIDIILENNLYSAAQPASPDQIGNTEKKLGLSFATEYKVFLSTVGACLCFGHEIKGIADNSNLSVLDATVEARKSLDLIPHSWYVIEDFHMDGIIILQDKNGSVYQMAPETAPFKIADSLEAYLIGTQEAAGSDDAQINHETELERKARGAWNSQFEEARRKLNHPDQVEKVLQQMEKKLEKIPGIGDWLADVPAVISLVRSYIRKEYRDVPVGSIVAALAAILYVVSPVDLIPDVVPVVGMLDDAAVFVVCWKMIHNDVDRYQAWRTEMGKDV